MSVFMLKHLNWVQVETFTRPLQNLLFALFFFGFLFLAIQRQTCKCVSDYPNYCPAV